MAIQELLIITPSLPVVLRGRMMKKMTIITDGKVLIHHNAHIIIMHTISLEKNIQLYKFNTVIVAVGESLG